MAQERNLTLMFPLTADEPEMATELAEDGLIAEILQGRKELYETLVRRHLHRVTRIARHFFGAAEVVDDIVQETFVKAYLALATYQQGACFRHWLARIAVNNCYDELRRKKKKGEVLLSELSDDGQSASESWAETWLDQQLIHQQQRLNKIQREQADAASVSQQLLRQLPPEDQVILTLLHAQEYTVKEISAMLGWSEAKVKIRAFRARNHLRRAYDRMRCTEQRLAGRNLSAPLTPA